jgi:hypothetical protein
MVALVKIVMKMIHCKGFEEYKGISPKKDIESLQKTETKGKSNLLINIFALFPFDIYRKSFALVIYL